MSSERESGGDNEPASALDVFTEANARFQQEIERIDPSSPQGSRRLIEATDEFLGSVAEVDPREALKRQTIQIVADNVDFMTKKSAERELNEMIRERASDNDGRPRITELLRENVDTIEKLATDEAEGEVRYRFVFRGGDSMIVDPETLYSPTEFRRAYNGIYDVLPRFEGQQEDWENLLYELQEDRLVSKMDSIGPRSAAISDIRGKVNSNEAYLDPADAARHSGILIRESDLEAAEGADTVWLLSDDIRRICEDHEVSVEEIRVEMDNRDLRKGSSKEIRFDGRRAYFWPLDRSEFEPKLIEPVGEEDDSDA